MAAGTAPGRRRVLAAVAILAAAPLVGACGFRPLYAGGTAPSVVPELAAIHIAQGPGRLGQVVTGYLLDRLTPLGPPEEPKYELRLRLREEREGVALERDATVTRFNLRLVAEFTLDDAAAERRLTEGVVQTVAAYNALRSGFANVIAERDARERAARVLSEEIKTRLSVYFVRRQAETP